MNVLRVILAALVAVVIGAGVATAQDVAITNARIIVGSGQVINSGTIVVRGGKIVSVTQGPAATQGLSPGPAGGIYAVIDAKGMSAVPGYIDAHKHVNTGCQGWLMTAKGSSLESRYFIAA